MENIPEYNFPSEPTQSPQMLDETAEVFTSSEDDELSLFQDLSETSIRSEILREAKDDKSTGDPTKEKRNAYARRITCPKSPAMLFSELYKGVQVDVKKRRLFKSESYYYRASIAIDGRVYVGEHFSKSAAKQKACERFFCAMLRKKMNKQPTGGVDTENGSSVPPKAPPAEDLPWPQFESLAMYTLLDYWKLLPADEVEKGVANETSNEPSIGMKKFPDNPKEYYPTQLLNHLKPKTEFECKPFLPRFEVTCEINGTLFRGQGATKKEAKKRCAIEAIKKLWNFDYDAA